MDHLKIGALADRIRSKRAGQGIRAAAQEVGISSATLSRVENGGVPDLETFGRICSWLGDDPARYLGLATAHSTTTSKVLVHFKKENAIRPETATALSEMIILAHKMLREEEEVQG
jgi:transcriptional regulator with XRE-family HTH domain